MQKLARRRPGVGHPEGPVWDTQEGALYWVDMLEQ